MNGHSYVTDHELVAEQTRVGVLERTDTWIFKDFVKNHKDESAVMRWTSGQVAKGSLLVFVSFGEGSHELRTSSYLFKLSRQTFESRLPCLAKSKLLVKTLC